jgi:hypothetical protein
VGGALGKQALLFLQKNKQKNFDSCGAIGDMGPQAQKFFGAFFQKRTACLRGLQGFRELMYEGSK